MKDAANLKAIDAELYRKMIVGGASGLKSHLNVVNELNVFPIPDGASTASRTVASSPCSRPVARAG